MTPAPTAAAAAVAPTSAPAPLAPEDLQTQLAAIEVLTAMWAGDDELELSSTYHHRTTLSSRGSADGGISAQMASLDLQQRAGSASASSARESGGAEDHGDGEGGGGDKGRGVEALVEYLAMPLEMLGGDESQRVKAALPASIVLGLSIDPLAGSEEEREANARAPGEQHEEGEEEKRRRKALTLARKLMLDVSFSLRRSAPPSSSSSTSIPPQPAPSRRSDTWPQVRLRRQLDWLPATLARSAAQEALRRAAGLRRKDGRFEALPLCALADPAPDAGAASGLCAEEGEDKGQPGNGEEAGEEGEEEEADIASTVLDLVERISEAAARVLPPLLAAAASSTSPNTNHSQSTSGAAQQQQRESQRTTREVYRSWSCLPSLSTREKRAELVAYARAHEPPLTGFVLAGKPALVVLEYPLADRPEGGSGGGGGGKEEQEKRKTEREEGEEEEARRSLLAYWSEIKTRSWADIQASHKKVSETLVERRVARCFYPSPSSSSSSSAPSASTYASASAPTPTLTLELGMEDVTGTDQVGGKEALRGTYKHRNDWRLVERWLEALRCGGRLKSALGADW